MYDFMQSLDVTLFRFVNQSLSNPFFDKVMPIFGGAPGFGFVVAAVLLFLIIKGGVKGRLFVLVLLLGVGFCDGVVCNTLKHAVGRLRPFNDILDANVLLGRGGSGSMPSSHAANCFAATLISFLFYRRSLRFMLPLALTVSFSRVYTGVHYPGDVLAGALLGAGSGIAVAWGLAALWRVVGARWFPLWLAQHPSLFCGEQETGDRGQETGGSKPINPQSALSNPQSALSNPQSAIPNPQSLESLQWLRVGYLLIGVLFLVHIGYLAAGRIELSEDEAYQWLWSKHLALSYYSKPPLIAYTQFLGTHLWGDTMFGVRFFSPVITALLSVLLLRFMARELSARAGVLLLLLLCATPLTALGANLMTIDPLSVLFWTAAMIAGWRAAQPEGTTRQWLWVGLWMGLGFLSKYTNLFQWLCWLVFFLLWSPARKHLRRPGPYLAFLLNGLCALPVLIWNAQHDWVTVEHVSNDGKLTESWRLSWQFLKYMGDFLGAEFAVLNPVFFVGLIWAAVAFWLGRKKPAAIAQPDYPLQVFLFAMGAPLFLFYFLFTLHSRVEANWIAPSVVPLFCLMIVYFGNRWDWAGKKLKPWLGIGIGLGLFLVVLAHETDLLAKISHRPIPSKLDVLRRLRGWQSMAEEVGKARAKLEAEDGKPTFIIGDHYGITSEITFYLPEAKARAQSGVESLVYFRATVQLENQFNFWPKYLRRKGENAIFVHKLSQPSFTKDWFEKWRAGRFDYYQPNRDVLPEAPWDMKMEFETVTDLGIKEIFYQGHLMHRIQLFECKNLANPASLEQN